MKRKLVNEINKIKTNKLDTYVSNLFEENLPDKKDILASFKKFKNFLKIEPCMWALVFALDGEAFDELLIDEYVYYEVTKDLRFICCNEELESCVSYESIVRIANSKEFRCIYQFLPSKILDALVFSKMKNMEENISAFRRILETQRYAGQPVLRNFSINNDNEMALLRAIFRKSKDIKIPPALVFYVLHDYIGANICLESHGYKKDMIYSDIITVLKDKNVRSKYIQVPGLLAYTIRYWNYDMIRFVFNSCFSFNDIMKAITAEECLDCYSSTFKNLISYIYEKYPEKFIKFEIALLGYVNKDDLIIHFQTMFNLVSLERELRKFNHSSAFKKAVIALPVAYGLFKEFRKGRPEFQNGLKIVLDRYDIKFENLISLIEPIIDEENQAEMEDFQAFKNLFK